MFLYFKNRRNKVKMLIENLFLIPIIIFLVGIINKFFLDAKKEFKPHLNSSRNKLIINGKDVKNREKT